nr:phospholipase A [Oceanococcus sp. HetDA_MAG_MS8]
MSHFLLRSVSMVVLLAASRLSWAQDLPPLRTDAFESCLREALLSAPGETAVANLRAICAEAKSAPEGVESQGPSPLERRVQVERATQWMPFVLTPYRPNYVMPFTYHDSPNQASTGGDAFTDRAEIKFQLSVRFPVWQQVLGSRASLNVAYTAQSFWQAYDAARSRPFRETNHEPELFLSIPVDWNVLGSRLSAMTLGLVHQSNGRDLPDSRSWNRVAASFIWEVQGRTLIVRPWVRIPDPEKTSPDDPRGDENPNIERFVGQFEVIFARKLGSKTYSAVWRNNARSDNRGSLELNWSFPLSGRARGYVQYFAGYGESLIDYDQHHNRLGFGVAITDWL